MCKLFWLVDFKSDCLRTLIFFVLLRDRIASSFIRRIGSKNVNFALSELEANKITCVEATGKDCILYKADQANKEKVDSERGRFIANNRRADQQNTYFYFLGNRKHAKKAEIRIEAKTRENKNVCMRQIKAIMKFGARSGGKKLILLKEINKILSRIAL